MEQPVSFAIAAPQRSRALPDVPTMAEAGGPPGLMVGAWLAIVAPRGTPAEVVRKINAEVNKALADPEIVQQLQTFGFEAAPESPEQLAEEIRSDVKKFAELVRRTGATAE